jgi:membrane associated rhomboid family serine protease
MVRALYVILVRQRLTCSSESRALEAELVGAKRGDRDSNSALTERGDWMIPIGDEIGTRRTPWMNYLLIGFTIWVWFFVQGAGGDLYRMAASVCNWGVVPGELTRQAPLGLAVPMGPGIACVVDDYAINWLTPFTSMFLHGSWGHLLGNMLFLWVFGDNIEDSLGHLRYLAFYLICGMGAVIAHLLTASGSPVPTVGASGAISGIMGAYLLLHPNIPVRMLFFIFVVRIRAWIVLIYWFVLQLVEGLSQLGPMRPDISAGVAVWAHVGGFVTGLLLIRRFVNPRLVAAPYLTR